MNKERIEALKELQEYVDKMLAEEQDKIAYHATEPLPEDLHQAIPEKNLLDEDLAKEFAAAEEIINQLNCLVVIGVDSGKFIIQAEGNMEMAAGMLYNIMSGRADVKVLETLQQGDEDSKECLEQMIKYIQQSEPLVKASEVFK